MFFEGLTYQTTQVVVTRSIVAGLSSGFIFRHLFLLVDMRIIELVIYVIIHRSLR